ncbi:inverse autotransporter beta domain-containing protein, partial [Serratia quinivorans]|uniref:inverse autotransporter beta domain-containing protein n=1 Tax=Serratia quinivorans TaxID=137545 RepID=UPI0021BD5A6E
MHTINDTKVMSTRYIAFFCLILQLLWVFFSAYLPSSLAYADDGKNVASSSHSLFSSNTVLYTLGEGESVSSVAKKFDLTINELKMLNQFRTYSKPFDNLSRGDVVDIPSKNLADKGYLYEDNQNKEEDYIVNSMSTVGGMLSSGDVGRQSKSLAKGFAVGEVNHRLSDFLGRFGTAKVQLNMDDKLNFDGSSADVLVPIWDKDKYLAFSQWGIRYKDERTTWNLGFGLRYFKDSWMFGVNSFYDYDLTGENRRWGVGAEAWTDYLKLSTNGYFRINDWHQSRDLEDFDERPADGFDIQAEAYIPSYSQLGGKLGFEHYRGQNVALFGSNHLQKNPSAVTIGVNYTPIPLVTIAVEHKNGQGGEHDTQLKLDATLQLGVPLYQQLDSSNVSNLRTLEGSRYDLVNRNNDIILDYRKQELISLELTPKSLSGEGSETGTIVANVKAKYGVERIDWNAAELIAAGGSIQEISKQTLRVVYPKYDVNAKNNYDVNAVAYDSHGNSSNADISHISVSEPSIIEPTISVIKDDAIANGIDSNIVQVKVTDSNGNALSDKQVVFKSDASVEIESPTVTTDAQGLGQTSLRSTDAESFKVLASVDGINTETVVTFTANASAATVSSLSSDVPAQVADGSSAITFTAVLKDSNGNLVAEAPVAFSTTGGTLAQPSATTNAQGEARVTLTSTQVGGVTVTAKAQENAADGGKSQAVTFTANA